MLVKKNRYSSIKRTVCIITFTLFLWAGYSNGGVWLFELNTPYWYIRLDASAYADISYWYPSIRHNCTANHEMLTGEWAAAIYYDGIATGEQAMWLTDGFQVPTWPTNSNFSTVSYSTWNDENNPIWENPYDPPNPPYDPTGKFDTGRSIIENDEVQITIDYEMVDLGESGSPLSFGSLVGADAFVYSERYILLQTYTITNKTTSSIQNLQFYQMLHGHPAGEVDPAVFSVYDDTAHEDPLEDYEPYNEVHCEEGSMSAGNFKYDITQWNNPDDPYALEDHRDWIGFSSTVEPDLDPVLIENGHYDGHAAGKPATGTHVNIEAKNLNEQPYSFGEAAGAMGWSLGTLDASGGENDSVKLTLAIMFGAGPIQRTCDPFEQIANWGFDEGAGDIAYDSVGSNNGTLMGDPQWVTGFHDGALEFTEYGDYVKLDHGIGALTGDSVTISAWIRPSASVVSGRYYDVFSQTKGDSSDLYGYGMYLSVDGSGVCKPGFSLRYPGCNVVSSAGIGTNEWSWLVGTNDGRTLTLYVNGASVGFAASGDYGGVFADAFIAGHVPGEWDFLGRIDDVWVLACPWDGEEGCLPYCHQDYFDWVLLGRPACWCTDYQCDGDAAVDVHYRGYRVFTTDLTILSDSWKKQPGDPGFSPCADFNHQQDHVRGYRVYTEDLNILSSHWKWGDKDDLRFIEEKRLPGDCEERGCGEAARGSGTTEQVTSKELLDWLAEIWLDPEVREGIDAKAWLKLYQSLKE